MGMFLVGRLSVFHHCVMCVGQINWLFSSWIFESGKANYGPDLKTTISWTLSMMAQLGFFFCVGVRHVYFMWEGEGNRMVLLLPITPDTPVRWVLLLYCYRVWPSDMLEAIKSEWMWHVSPRRMTVKGILWFLHSFSLLLWHGNGMLPIEAASLICFLNLQL